MARALIAVALAGTMALAVSASAEQARPAIPGMPKGYLAVAAPPESLLLAPPPPAPGSAAELRDQEASKAALALKNGPRWTLAEADADLFTPKATRALSCAAGVEISATTTPKLDQLLRRSGSDLGLSTSAIKKKHQRPRPFMVNGEGSCTPSWEPMLRKDGSYPSGHSAIGYGWGLILAELIPSRAEQLVARGRAFGDSRRVCNVHWQSDTEEGRVAAAAVVARLHADKAFQKDVKAARAELTKLGGKHPPQGCEAEAAALALSQ